MAIQDYSSYAASSAHNYAAGGCVSVVQKADFPMWEAAGFTPIYRNLHWGVMSKKLGVEIGLYIDGESSIEYKIQNAQEHEQVLVDLFPVLQAALPKGWTVKLPDDKYCRYQFFVVSPEGKEQLCPRRTNDWKQFYFQLRKPITKKLKAAIKAAVDAPRN